MAAIREESRPPESSMANGASDMSRFTTELTSFSCREMSSLSAGSTRYQYVKPEEESKRQS